jgi:hypothetical protein
MISNQQLLTEVRHPEPLENLVESIPVRDGIKLSEINPIFKNSKESWTDLLGLGWLVCEDWS